MQPGDYIKLKVPLIRIRADSVFIEHDQKKLKDLFKIDLIRTLTQDPRFGIRQMVDIALRALSPGVNDPTTAMDALNEISTVLDRFIGNYGHSGEIQFESGTLLKLKHTSIDVCTEILGKLKF